MRGIFTRGLRHLPRVVVSGMTESGSIVTPGRQSASYPFWKSMKTRNDRTIAQTAKPNAGGRIPKLNRRDFVALSVGTGVTAGFALAVQPAVAQTTNERKFPMPYSNKHINTPFGDIAYTERARVPLLCLCTASSRMLTCGGM